MATRSESRDPLLTPCSFKYSNKSMFMSSQTRICWVPLIAYPMNRTTFGCCKLANIFASASTALTNCVSVPSKTLAAAGAPRNVHLNTVPDDPPPRYLVRSISTSLCISDGRWPTATLSVDLRVFSKWLARPSMWWWAFRNLEKKEGLCAFTWRIMHSLSSLNSSSASVCDNSKDK